ncbi:MAG TPA: hypothetical protein VNJ71_00930 [Gemmatimonadales bacterium]|jgi:hypothetical protein|nr:hypothetical protein [Gemmatimonadales bacterium]
MTVNPFGGERDEALGRLLRETLDPGLPEAFVRRVLAALPAERSSWDVLAGWARPGLAALLLLAAALGWALGLATRETGREAATAASVVAGEVLGEPETPAPDVLVAVALGIE